jgi:hypothetical protein
MLLSDRTEKVVLGCKNAQLATILRGMGADFADLSRRGFNTPTLKELDKANGEEPWFCSIHTRLPCCYEEERREFRCSLRKCVYLWQWIKQQLNSIKMQDIKKRARAEAEAQDRLLIDLREQQELVEPTGLLLRWSLITPNDNGKTYHTSPLAFQSYADCMDDYVAYFQQGHDIPDSLKLQMVIKFEGLDQYLSKCADLLASNQFW